jgi:nucleotide-binding universal stress UspA family protein
MRVRTATIAGSAAGALVELSSDACLVVVGGRGAGGFAGLALGSVAAQVVRHAHAPVVVVRPPVVGTAVEAPCQPAPHLAPIVVGVDGSATSATALEFAFDEAAARGVPLIAIYAWWLLPLGNLGPTTPLHWESTEALEEAQRILSEATAGWSEKYPDVTVLPIAEHSMNPAWSLIEASRRAGLLVVGSRGRGGFASLLLGSVSATVVAHAACPVAVVRPGVHG